MAKLLDFGPVQASALRLPANYYRNNFRFPLLARRCYRAGFNAVTLVAPYHFQRRPRHYGPVSNLCQYVLGLLHPTTVWCNCQSLLD
ncbi:MAG: hypothetical protein ACLQVY_03620 [Limisphaerales bacterium]